MFWELNKLTSTRGGRQDKILFNEDPVTQVVGSVLHHSHPRPSVVAPEWVMGVLAGDDLHVFVVVAVLILVEDCTIYATFFLKRKLLLVS